MREGQKKPPVPLGYALPYLYSDFNFLLPPPLLEEPVFLLRDGTPVLPLSLTDLFSAQLQGDQRLVSGAPKPQEQDMALTAGHHGRYTGPHSG